MAETFTALATRALSTDFDPVGQLTVAKGYAKEGVREIYRTTRLHRGDIAMTLHNLFATQTQIIITSPYGPVPAAYIEAVVFVDNGDDLLPMDYADILRLRGQNRGLTGRPEFFAVTPGDPTTEQTSVEVWPTPSVDYQFFVAGAGEPDATQFDDTDQVPLPDAWLKLIYYYTRANLFSDDGDTEMFSHWDTRWINGCTAMRSDLQRTVKANRIVPGTWAGAGSGRPTFHYKGQTFS